MTNTYDIVRMYGDLAYLGGYWAGQLRTVEFGYVDLFGDLDKMKEYYNKVIKQYTNVELVNNTFTFNGIEYRHISRPTVARATNIGDLYIMDNGTWKHQFDHDLHEMYSKAIRMWYAILMEHERFDINARDYTEFIYRTYFYFVNGNRAKFFTDEEIKIISSYNVHGLTQDWFSHQ